MAPINNKKKNPTELNLKRQKMKAYKACIRSSLWMLFTYSSCMNGRTRMPDHSSILEHLHLVFQTCLYTSLSLSVCVSLSLSLSSPSLPLSLFLSSPSLHGGNYTPTPRARAVSYNHYFIPTVSPKGSILTFPLAQGLRYNASNCEENAQCL
jgi:hypothetical protein